MIDATNTNENDIMSDTEISTNVTARFNEIYNETNKSILAFITARCGNTSDISDIFQDVYMELYQILAKYGADYITNGKAYVFKIARHKLAQHYSILSRLRTFVSLNIQKNNDETTDLDIEMIEDSFLSHDNLEEYVVNQMLLEEARRLIRQKSKDIRKIFYLFYDVRLTIPEIAKELSMSESNVKNKLYRTVKELQNVLNISEKGGQS